MFVKLLIGRAAGSIIDLRFDAAESGLAMGTCVLATEDEIALAGLPPENGPSAVIPDAFPEGYSAKAHEVGGYMLFGPDGAQVRDEPFTNLSAARSFADELVASAVAAADEDQASRRKASK
jgi:hypothetical protein